MFYKMTGLNRNIAKGLVLAGGDGVSDGVTLGADLELKARAEIGLMKRNDTSAEDDQNTEASNTSTTDSEGLSSSPPTSSSTELENTTAIIASSVAEPVSLFDTGNGSRMCMLMGE